MSDPNPLLSFAQLVRDFFTDDSEGQAIYLRQQAENAIAAATRSATPTLTTEERCKLDWARSHMSTRQREAIDFRRELEQLVDDTFNEAPEARDRFPYRPDADGE